MVVLSPVIHPRLLSQRCNAVYDDDLLWLVLGECSTSPWICL